jgi:TonB family protein
MSRVAILALCLALAHATTARAQDARRDAPPPPAAAPVLTKPPVLIQSVAPDYPPAALAAGKTADVTVRIAIDADGLVTDVTVVAPVGDGFDAAAIAAAKQYLFEPAEFDGKPGPITVETVIHFVIDQAPPPPPPRPDDPATVDPAAEGPPSHGGDFRCRSPSRARSSSAAPARWWPARSSASRSSASTRSPTTPAGSRSTASRPARTPCWWSPIASIGSSARWRSPPTSGSRSGCGCGRAAARSTPR